MTIQVTLAATSGWCSDQLHEKFDIVNDKFRLWPAFNGSCDLAVPAILAILA